MSLEYEPASEPLHIDRAIRNSRGIQGVRFCRFQGCVFGGEGFGLGGAAGRGREGASKSPQRLAPGAVQREFFIDNLLVRIHFIIVTIRWTGLAPWEFGLRVRVSDSVVLLDEVEKAHPRVLNVLLQVLSTLPIPMARGRST